MYLSLLYCQLVVDAGIKKQDLSAAVIPKSKYSGYFRLSKDMNRTTTIKYMRTDNQGYKLRDINTKDNH